MKEVKPVGGRAKSMKIENGQMFWSDVVKRIPALDAFWIKDWIIDLNETLVDDPVGAGSIIIIYSVYEVEGRLWVHVCQHRKDGFTVCCLHEIEPSELKVFFGPGIVKEVLQKLGLRA